MITCSGLSQYYNTRADTYHVTEKTCFLHMKIVILSMAEGSSTEFMALKNPKAMQLRNYFEFPAHNRNFLESDKHVLLS